MKIAVNFRMVQKGNLTGIGFFTSENFQRIAAKHPEHTFYFIFDSEIPQEYTHLSSNVIPVKVTMKSRFRGPLLWFWFEKVLSRTLKKINPDIFVAPDSLMPLSIDIPTVIAVHDLNFVHYPEFMPGSACRFYRKYTPLYLKKAKRIAAVSGFTKKDIIETYNTDEEKIDVVYSGYNGGFKPASEKEKQETQKQYAANCPFFVFVGSIHPRKNLINQLRAFDIFRKKNPQTNHKFIVIGTPWIWEKEDQETLEGLTYKNDILFLGRLPDEEMRTIVSSAEAMMYVSIFEGFGLPILEGFYSEIPVITANVSSMPEIAGNAAICVDPFNPQDIADAMTKIVTDTQVRKTLIERGKERRETYSWDDTAERLWQSVQKIIASIDSQKVQGKR